MSELPLKMRWQGDTFLPLGRSAQEADARFVIGQVYALEEIMPRSEVSHRHFFACVAEGWKTLSEADEERFPTVESLRKWALIKGGYRDERSIVCSSKAEAARVAAFIKPMDEYAVVTVIDGVVRVYTARSQSMKAMGATEFNESKQIVLGYIAELVGVTPDALSKNAGVSA